MEYPSISRDYQVAFFEKDEHLWRITSHLKDPVHDVLVTIDVDVPDMVIRDADVKFIRQPIEGCSKMIEVMKKIVGASLYTNLREILTEHFTGRVGCTIVRNLIIIAAPGFPFFYYPYLISKGKLTREKYEEMVRTKVLPPERNCIAA